MTRVLLYCPLNPNPPRLWRRTMESILKMKWAEPIDYVFSANDNPYAKPYENILHQYNKAREMTLTGGYDYLFTVESDMIVPVDALTRLASLDAGVAYGLYVFRHTRHNWSAYTSIEQKAGHSLSEYPEAAKDAWGSVRDVAGVGLGCTLISKNTLKRIGFRLFDDAPDKTSCDWAFALDCNTQGITQRCDLGVVCGHISYTPYPLILWPDPNERSLYRRESLEGVEMKQIKAGDTFHVGMGETVLAPAKDNGNGQEGHHVEPVKVERGPSKKRKALATSD